MPRVPLLGGAYRARSLIASAQRCVNLYAELNPDPQAPVPVTHYPTPGLRSIATPDFKQVAREVYTASNGNVYAIIGSHVFSVASDFAMTEIGTIADLPTPVSMADNGQVIVIVDGTTVGYCINMADNDFGQILDTNYLGAATVDFIDGFFVFEKPDTAQWYISLSTVSFAMLRQSEILDGSITSGGSLYTNGTYDDVPLTGGSGSGATAQIVISGAAVTGVSITTGGTGYVNGETLSANASDVGGTGSGFTWQISEMNPAFDPLDIVSKQGGADPVAAVAANRGELWILGTQTSEVWVNTGAADFAFQRVQGGILQQGCAAKNSVAQLDTSLFWLAQDKKGKGIVVQAQGYQAQRVSTHSIEAEIQRYSTISDAIGFCFQQNGHAFYVLTFPSADKTWLMEVATKQWSEFNWTDPNGTLRRHRANCCCFGYGVNIVGDWQNGTLYALDPNVFDDNGQPIKRIRTFPHLIKDGKRVRYERFVADVQVGTLENTLPQQVGVNGVVSSSDEPLLTLRWSDDRGVSYGDPIMQGMGASGEYLTQVAFSRLGMARDRVFEVSWSSPINTSLLGAFIDGTPLKS